MGTINKRDGLGDALFSKTQQLVLGLLFGNSQRSYYVKEVMRLACIGIGTVHRELEKLAEAGLLTVKKIGNQKHYQANPEAPIFDELRGIVLKTFGVVKGVHKNMSPNDKNVVTISGDLTVSRVALMELIHRYHICRLVLFGSAAHGKLGPQSDIDLLVEFEQGTGPSIGGIVTIQKAFSELFRGLKVDLTTPSILNNPYRRRAIEKNMEELYAA